MELLRGDTHFAAKAELPAVGEAGGGVDVDGGGVDIIEEALGGGFAFGHDCVRVVRRVRLNVLDCRIQRGNHADGQNVIEKFRVKIVRASRLSGDDGERLLVQPELDGGKTCLLARVDKGVFEHRQERLGDTRMHEADLLRIADRGAARLGVDDDGKGFFQIRVFVHIHVADASSRFDAGDGCVLDACADEACAASRDEKVDKTGHVTPAYVTFEVYADNASVGAPKASVITATRNLIYNTADYVVGEYALVTVSESSLAGGKVATAEKTTAVATGVLRGYTASTTRVGEETYNDADLFVLGNAKITDSYGKTYDVFVDQYGNVIGLVPTANNYLVIEAIRWIHDGTLYGGSALANVVLADGSRVENVTIASVAGRLTTNTGDAFGDADSATVSDYYTNNGEYYNHLASYVVNADGTYAITSLKDDTTAADNDTVCAAADLDNVAITKGLTTMVSKTNTVVANDNTVFLVKQSNGTYETYVGKNNVPSMTDATICYLTSNGYATVVLVTKYTLASNSFVAYVPAETTARLATDWYYGVYNGRYAYEVYKVGETEPTTIYSNDADLFKFSQISTLGDRDGFYDITVDANGVVTSSVRFIGTYAYDTVTNITTAHGGYLWDRAWVRTNLVGNSLQTADKAGTTANKDFFVDNAKYFVITRVTLPTGSTYTTVTEGSAADMVAGTKVIVAYTNAANNPAAYVYVIAAEGAAVDPAQDKYTVHSTANPWPVTVNNVGVIAPTCYTNIVAAGGTGADALAGAMANATKLSLRSLTAVATGEYKIQASGMTTGVITVWQTSAQVPVAINVTTAANTAEWQGTLAVGNYVVIADASAAGTANYYAVYEIVE